MKRLVILGLLAILLVTCTSQAPTRAQDERFLLELVYNGSWNGSWFDIYRFTDNQIGVICYITRTDGGIDCLPLSKTRLIQ